MRGELHQPPGRATRGRPLVVMLHGMSSSRKEFFDFPERLSRRGYSVLAFDFRGHGESDGPRGLQSKPRALADVRAGLARVQQEYGVDRTPWGLIGHSLGGALALSAAPYLAGLGCLVALAPVWKLRAEMNPVEFFAYNLARAVNAPVRLFHRDGLRVPYKVDYRRLYVDAAALERARAAAFLQRTVPVNNYAPLVRDLDAAESARAVQVPTLVAVAEKDIVVGKYHSRRVYEALAGPKELVEIPDSGHSMCGDRQSELVLAHCARFLGAHLGGGGG